MSEARTDRIFKALADPTRRRILDLLAARPRTTGELCEAFSKLSRFAVMKHLNVLQRAELLLVTREGRQRWNSINAVPLVEALRRWVDRYQALWAGAMLNIRDVAESAPSGASPAPEAEPDVSATLSQGEMS